jgi:hypothetical protein
MPSLDLVSYDFALPQSLLQPMPTTVASATTIAPTTMITLVSGSTAIATVTPPQSGAHMLIFVSTGTWAMTAAGNITTAVAATTVGMPVLLFYNPATAKYYAGKLAIA